MRQGYLASGEHCAVRVRVAAFSYTACLKRDNMVLLERLNRKEACNAANYNTRH